jgi:FkbM family methyltransferase
MTTKASLRNVPRGPSAAAEPLAGSLDGYCTLIAVNDFSEIEQRRIALTIAVRDTDTIPKVPNAGEVTVHDGVPVQIMHNGILVGEGCYYGAWMTEVIRQLRGHHEPQEELAFHTILKRLAGDTQTPTVVELGSFWAYYSLWAKHDIPAARLTLVEPDAGNLAVGRRNLELNGMEAASMINAAVGDEHGTTVTLIWDSDEQAHAIRQVTVDGLMEDQRMEKIDLLLCDVQGAEVAMLQGAIRALREKRVRFIVISTHHHRITRDPLTHQRCMKILREAGAHFIAEHSASESCSGDGLIAVSMDGRDGDLKADVSIVRSRDTLFGELEWELAETQWLRNLRPKVALHAAKTKASNLRARIK